MNPLFPPNGKLERRVGPYSPIPDCRGKNSAYQRLVMTARGTRMPSGGNQKNFLETIWKHCILGQLSI